jgi:hypothetical protein
MQQQKRSLEKTLANANAQLQKLQQNNVRHQPI